MKFAEEFPPTYIYHFAGYGNMAWMPDSHEMIQANIINLYNLLLATGDTDYKAFINASSSSVYGDKKHPMHETNSLEATDWYGITKIAGELLIRAYVSQYLKPVISVRPFSVYGPGENALRFIPTAIHCVKYNEPMQLAPGKHDWIYIDDFLEALLLVQEYAKDLKGKAVNIGSGQQYDNYDIVKYLAMFAKKNVNLLPITNIKSLRSRDNWVADNSLLKSFGWIQHYSLSEGLKKTYDSFK